MCAPRLAMIFTCAGLSACGMTFTDVPRGTLPEDWTDRSFVPNPANYRYNLDDVLGTYIFRGEDGKLRAAAGGITVDPNIILREDYRDTGDGKIFEAIFSGKTAVELGFSAASVGGSADVAYNTLINDLALVAIPRASAPCETLLAIASRALPSGVTNRYWIYNVRLTEIVSSTATKIDANASDVATPVFGIGGSVFSDQRNWSRDYRVSFGLMDIAEYAEITNQIGGCSTIESISSDSDDLYTTATVTVPAVDLSELSLSPP